MAELLVAEDAVADALDAARSWIDRVEPHDLGREVLAGALVVDLRPQSDRDADGVLPGAVAIERIHLEWRLAPSSPHRLRGVTPDTRAVLVCNEGYASSLAAATLRDLGLPRATDLVGGYRAWATATAPT